MLLTQSIIRDNTIDFLLIFDTTDLIIMIQITATVVVFIVTLTTGITQRIISPQLSELQTLCPGEEVTITCETRGSPVIAWRSEEYIGSGVLIEFGNIHSVGYTSYVNSNTVATLINNTIDNGVSVLVSQLRIIALSGSLTSSVTCIHNFNRATDTIVFHGLGIFHPLLHMAVLLISNNLLLVAC